MADVTGAPALDRRKGKRKQWLRWLLSAALLCVAGAFVWRELRGLSVHEIWLHVRERSWAQIGAACALAVVNYLQLTRFDALALRYLNQRLPERRLVLASFIATAFGHNIGPSVASGGSIRLRFYSAWGIPAWQVATLIAFLSVTFFIGLCAVAGITFVSCSAADAEHLPLPLWLLRTIGGVFLGLLVAYLAVCARGPTLTLRGKRVSPPRIGIALGQIATGGLDWLMMAAIFSLLLPSHTASYFEVLRSLLVAQVAGVFSQVPGGLGVFESLMLSSLGHIVSAPELLGTLLLYRALYFFLPLLFALLLMLVSEVRRKA
ncbi:MAG TPA: lysylphosphatidylglycerol synthase domain-containing protein [Polyangiaceae bacterium]|nr:lysylphosphatidylglycerol synthase domain-containing protein [Polyangiaceae bacterium]